MSATYPDLPFTTFPDSVQEFPIMMDITEDDAELVNNFQKALQDGDMEAAQEYLVQIPNYTNKFITAELLNKLMQTCIALQRVIEEG